MMNQSQSKQLNIQPIKQNILTQQSNHREDADDKQKQKQSMQAQQVIPDHFYDSDLASINEKDFLSDNEPPKDNIQQRKLLFKEKKMHVYKTIVKLGISLDKPARYDKIRLKFKSVPQDKILPYPLKKQKQAQYIHPQYFSSHYLMDIQQVSYHVGKEYFDIQRFVTSLKRGEVAVFEIQYLQISKKSNIKIRERIEVFVIEAYDWLTVIDMDCDGKYMKQVIRRGQGHSRIAKHDQVSFEYSIKRDGEIICIQKHEDFVKLQDKYIQNIPNIIWKLLQNLKNKEKVRLVLNNQTMKQCEQNKYIRINPENTQNQQQIVQWIVELQIFNFHSIDDIFMDGRLLKKLVMKGVSSSKPDSSSLVYYTLQFIGKQKEIIFRDDCFNSDWWQDFIKLDELKCRKNYLDDYSISQMLRQTIQRMKPGQIAQIECRDKSLFCYGSDYQDYKKYHALETVPQVIYLNIRVYNFTQGRNCFNMELQEKIQQSKRKKLIGIKLLKENNIEEALKIFQNIVSYYGSGNINQESYDQKISSLMNSLLCHMKLQNYLQVIKLCNIVLQLPRHGYDINKMKIKGPMLAKIEGNLPQEASDQRQLAQLHQNPLIIDKCLYRKGLALVKTGQGKLALQTLNLITIQSQEIKQLKLEADKLKAQYEKKSIKMFKNMFG